jgi:hypothetical protein
MCTILLLEEIICPFKNFGFDAPASTCNWALDDCYWFVVPFVNFGEMLLERKSHPISKKRAF